MTPEIQQWLMYAAIAFAGYVLRQWFPNLLPFLPPTPGTSPLPAPHVQPLQPQSIPASILDNPRALELLRELLHATPPARHDRPV